MRIRPALVDDAPRIAEAVAQQPLLRRYGVTEEGLGRDLARAIAAGDGVLVAEREQLIGLAWFHQRGTLGLGGYLRLIALQPGAEAAGVGRALLDAVERAIEARHLFLLVSDFNTDAQRFYERAGYLRSGALPGLVLPDVTELLYWKRLR